jgi:hypothetical protein
MSTSWSNGVDCSNPTSSSSGFYPFDSACMNRNIESGEQRFIDINIDSEVEETRTSTATSSKNQSPTYKLNASNLFKFGSSRATKSKSADLNNNVSSHSSYSQILQPQQASLNSTVSSSSATLAQKTDLILANLSDIGIDFRYGWLDLNC